jgi:hypothetical protein
VHHKHLTPHPNFRSSKCILQEEVIDDAKSCFFVNVEKMVVHIKAIIKLNTDPFDHVN